eukprot:scaffold895_cov315-Pinguiococcus_pyrenoidosus.AAC.47
MSIARPSIGFQTLSCSLGVVALPQTPDLRIENEGFPPTPKSSSCAPAVTARPPGPVSSGHAFASVTAAALSPGKPSALPCGRGARAAARSRRRCRRRTRRRQRTRRLFPSATAEAAPAARRSGRMGRWSACWTPAPNPTTTTARPIGVASISSRAWAWAWAPRRARRSKCWASRAIAPSPTWTKSPATRCANIAGDSRESSAFPGDFVEGLQAPASQYSRVASSFLGGSTWWRLGPEQSLGCRRPMALRRGCCGARVGAAPSGVCVGARGPLLQPQIMLDLAFATIYVPDAETVLAAETSEPESRNAPCGNVDDVESEIESEPATQRYDLVIDMQPHASAARSLLRSRSRSTDREGPTMLLSDMFGARSAPATGVSTSRDLTSMPGVKIEQGIVHLRADSKGQRDLWLDQLQLRSAAAKQVIPLAYGRYVYRGVALRQERHLVRNSCFGDEIEVLREGYIKKKAVAATIKTWNLRYAFLTPDGIYYCVDRDSRVAKGFYRLSVGHTIRIANYPVCNDEIVRNAEALFTSESNVLNTLDERQKLATDRQTDVAEIQDMQEQLVRAHQARKGSFSWLLEQKFPNFDSGDRPVHIRRMKDSSILTLSNQRSADFVFCAGTEAEIQEWAHAIDSALQAMKKERNLDAWRRTKGKLRELHNAFDHRVAKGPILAARNRPPSTKIKQRPTSGRVKKSKFSQSSLHDGSEIDTPWTSGESKPIRGPEHDPNRSIIIEDKASVSSLSEKSYSPQKRSSSLLAFLDHKPYYDTDELEASSGADGSTSPLRGLAILPEYPEDQRREFRNPSPTPDSEREAFPVTHRAKVKSIHGDMPGRPLSPGFDIPPAPPLRGTPPPPGSYPGSPRESELLRESLPALTGPRDHELVYRVVLPKARPGRSRGNSRSSSRSSSEFGGHLHVDVVTGSALDAAIKRSVQILDDSEPLDFTISAFISTAALGQEYAVVSSVSHGSQSEEAGLEVGSVLLSVGDDNVENCGFISALAKLQFSERPIAITLLRPLTATTRRQAVAKPAVKAERALARWLDREPPPPPKTAKKTAMDSQEVSRAREEARRLVARSRFKSAANRVRMMVKATKGFTSSVSSCNSNSGPMSEDPPGDVPHTGEQDPLTITIPVASPAQPIYSPTGMTKLLSAVAELQALAEEDEQSVGASSVRSDATTVKTVRTPRRRGG